MEASERSRRRSGEASKRGGGQAVSFSLRSRIGLFPPSVRMGLLLLHVRCSLSFSFSSSTLRNLSQS